MSDLKRHFPFGKCGLKLYGLKLKGKQSRSLPVWEVWIEILDRI